ncbi:MAG: BON domain-containing protein [bacterium]
MNTRYSEYLLVIFAVIALSCARTALRTACAAEMPRDQVITSWVDHALNEDPLIVSTDIHISTYKGIVTLSGSVKTLAEKRYADLEAKKIQGVLGVINELVVNPTARFDTDIAHDIRRRLINNAFIKAKGLDIHVSDGHATISGTVSSRAESAEAELLASEVRGVKSVVNNLTIAFPSKRADQVIKKDVISSMDRDVYLSGLPISVDVKDGVVTLNGSVGNAFQKKIARDKAFRVGNVKEVENNLQVKWQEEEGVREELPPRPSDDQLKGTLRLEFNEDPRLAPLKIMIEALSGHITLRGSVPSYYQKRIAEQDAKDVIGVSGVTNLLQVDAAERDDDAIRDDVVFEIKTDYALNAYEIDVGVKDGFVTLAGVVNSLYDKTRARIIASRVIGVRDVVNNIVVNQGGNGYSK